jgi:hypothetical protein
MKKTGKELGKSRACAWEGMRHVANAFLKTMVFYEHLPRAGKIRAQMIGVLKLFDMWARSTHLQVVLVT